MKCQDGSSSRPSSEIRRQAFLQDFLGWKWQLKIVTILLLLIIKPTAAALRRRATLACAQGIATWKNAHDFSFIPLLTKLVKSKIIEIILTPI